MESFDRDSLALSVFIMICAAIIGILYRYGKEVNLQAWFAKLRADAQRAVTDTGFRAAELADAENKLANAPKSIIRITIKKNHEVFLYVLPKIMMFLALFGVGLGYLGIFRVSPDVETNWAVYVALFFFLMVGALMVITDALRADYFRVQQLNRKYVMVKAGEDHSAILSTLKELLGHYPQVPELWVEYADQLARCGRVADALSSIEDVRRRAPGSMDLAIVELSLSIRNNELAPVILQ